MVGTGNVATSIPAAPPTDIPHFFISRTSADAAIAIAVADVLIAAGYRVLIPVKDFATRNFTDMMAAGPRFRRPRHCHYVRGLFPASAKKRWPQTIPTSARR